MVDPITQQLGVGGAIAAAIVYLVLKFRPWKNGTGDHKKSNAAGEQTTDFWRIEMQKIVMEANERQVVPILNRQTQILENMSKMVDRLISLEEFKRGG